MEKNAIDKLQHSNYASVNLAFIKKHLQLFPEDADVRLSSGITMRQMLQQAGVVLQPRKR